MPRNIYADRTAGHRMMESDILNDVFDYAAPEKHQEFIDWAGEALGVVFVFDRANNEYLCAYKDSLLVNEEGDEIS